METGDGLREAREMGQGKLWRGVKGSYGEG